MKNSHVTLVACAVAAILLACTGISPLRSEDGGTSPEFQRDVDRRQVLPTDITKRGPSGDRHPPVLHSSQFHTPVPLASEVNTAGAEDSPFVSADGNELWFTRTHRGTPGVFRSIKVHGAWQKPELIVSQFAGEPTLDAKGNLFFVHHYFEDGQMIEADIFVACRK